jgi:catechol 2,3-dioxygenase-like lactoylglutathione lyase family enzyme
MAAFRLRRLDHVSLNVGDRPRSISWRRDVLGLEPRNEEKQDDEPVFMGDFGACVALFQARSEARERAYESVGLRHVASMVGREDLKRAQARLCESIASTSASRTTATRTPCTSRTPMVS